VFNLTETQFRLIIGAVAAFLIALVPVLGLTPEVTTAIQALIGAIAGFLVPKV